MKKMNSVSKLALALVLVWSTAGCDEFIDTRVEMDTFSQSQPLDDFESLEVHIEYDIGNLEISEGSDDELYSIDLEYDRLHFDPDLDFDGAGSRASLTFDLDSVGRGFSGDRFNNDLLLRLNPDIPIDLRLSIGVAESHLDLTGLGLTRLRLDGGVGRTEILFGELSAEEMDDLDVEAGVGDVTIRSIGNARVRDLKVEGGIGRTELDFSGEWDDWTTEAEISVGVGHILLRIPRELAVEIRSDNSFLSNISAPGFERDNDRYTRNLGNGRTRIIIRIESGIGAVTIDLI